MLSETATVIVCVGAGIGLFLFIPICGYYFGLYDVGHRRPRDDQLDIVRSIQTRAII